MKEQSRNLINSVEPNIRNYGSESNFTRSFLWRTEAGDIMLTITASLKKSTEYGEFFLVKGNIDSSDVKGQGDSIWAFLTNQLGLLSREKNKKVIHEVHPNRYSVRLVKNDSMYVKKGKVYYAVYN